MPCVQGKRLNTVYRQMNASTAMMAVRSVPNVPRSTPQMRSARTIWNDWMPTERTRSR